MNKQKTITKQNILNLIKEEQLATRILEACGEEVFQEVERKDGDHAWVQFLGDEEYEQLINIGMARKKRCEAAQALCTLNDEEREVIQQLNLTAATRKREHDEPQRLVALAKAAAANPQRGAVDPLSDTVPTRRLRRENKIITKSFLRQIIKEEIEVVLSDEEAKEFFDIDVQKEFDKKETE